jgi:anti-sigma factor RsiW
MKMPHRFERQLSAYLDGELPPEEMTEVRRHLAGCPSCQAELEELRATKGMVGRLSQPQLPTSFESDLWRRVDREAPRRRWWPFLWPRPAMALAAVALALILIAVPVVRDHRDRLRAAEVGPDLFLRAATQAAADDPFMDRAYLGLVTTDADLRLAGEDPRGTGR